MSDMRFDVYRSKPNTEADCIIGRLSVDGVAECYSLERLSLAIPAGIYELVLYKSPRLGYELPLFLSVPERDHIEIHIGNWAKDVIGCLAVGTSKTTDMVQHSHLAFDMLMIKFRQGLSKGKVFIEVHDPIEEAA